MSVLIFIDHADGHVKKASWEVLCYGSRIAQKAGLAAEGIVLGTLSEELSPLGRYGISKIYQVAQESLNILDSAVHCQVLADVVQRTGAQIVIFPHDTAGKAIAPRLSAKLQAGLVTGAVSLPDLDQGFIVKKNVFSGKAFAQVSVQTPIKIITLNQNSFPVQESGGTAELVTLDIPVANPRVKLRSVSKSSGEVPLTEAEIVVSGGRGLKGPENWGMIEELAHALHAATACSRPVADAHWRPHHEHVGQTGLAIAPNLYLAIGISGAIQHLAGVNRSKVIAIVNKDPEAPFFKAADYGIVGDAFDIVPKLTAAVKKLRGLP
jgi:electron transfer flavoprotein alpha subunit